MIPAPLDASLLREHAFQGTNDLSTVLSPSTFTDEGGYKPVLKYGLGYFNYGLVIDDEVYDYSVCDIIRGHVYDHFLVLFLLFHDFVYYLVNKFKLVSQQQEKQV
ncbi:YCR043C-like protein [Saccharomyces cerevisiae AWRI796]|nr:YCR043C-like protein [Saccharomyces cerevisiae AWRI796]